MPDPTLQQATDDAIERAADNLSRGRVVAFPTETVYGLGADATNDEAVARIYQIKERPVYNPLIVHLATPEAAIELAESPDIAQSLMAAFWPGALTLVLNKSKTAPLAKAVTADQNSVALRCPSHPVARRLLKAFGGPIAAPSANLSGRTSPTSAAHVAESFAGRPVGKQPDMILAGGASKIGLESTIVDLTNPVYPIVLRQGGIPQEAIEGVIGRALSDPREKVDQSPPKAPGGLKRHYATTTPLRLDAVDVKSGEALLGFGSLSFVASEDYDAAKKMPDQLLRNLSAHGDLGEAAANLFHSMRELDKVGAKRIAVMKIPEVGLGRAINDRLRRAAVRADQRENDDE